MGGAGTRSPQWRLPMLRFYLGMLPECRRVFRGTIEAWLFWVFTLLGPLLIYFNPELKQMLEQEAVLSRWWALAPIGASILYGIMRVNYERFRQLESRVDKLRTRSVRQEAVDQLSRLREKANRGLFNRIPSNTLELQRWIEDYDDWQDEVIQVLETEFTYSTRHRFTDLVEMPIRDRGNVMRTGTEQERRQHAHYVNLLAARLQALGEIIEEHDRGEPQAADPPVSESDERM